MFFCKTLLPGNGITVIAADKTRWKLCYLSNRVRLLWAIIDRRRYLTFIMKIILVLFYQLRYWKKKQQKIQGTRYINTLVTIIVLTSIIFLIFFLPRLLSNGWLLPDWFLIVSVFIFRRNNTRSHYVSLSQWRRRWKLISEKNKKNE